MNIVLSLVLIPRIGIAGAAIAWAGSILVNNVVPLAEVRAFLKVHPFGRGFPAASGSALVCFGVFGMLLRVTVGTTMPAFVVWSVVATPATPRCSGGSATASSSTCSSGRCARAAAGRRRAVAGRLSLRSQRAAAAVRPRASASRPC